MKVQLAFLICSILVVFCAAYLHPKPRVLVVTEANQRELGLPIGTKLIKDKRTQLYVPPPVTEDFSPEARLEIQFINNVTSLNYCRVGPGVDSTKIPRNLDWKSFCRNSDDEDLCCGKTRCSCDTISNSCSCLDKKGFEYYEAKKNRDFENTLSSVDTHIYHHPYRYTPIFPYVPAFGK